MNMLPTNEQGHNLFHAAAVHGVPKPLMKLLQQYKKLSPTALLAKDSRGRTPAHLAALAGNLRALRLILDAAPDSLLIRDADQRNVLDILRHDDTPYTFQLRTRLVAWGSTSLGDGPGLKFLDQPKLTGAGVPRYGPRSIVKLAVSPTQALVVAQHDMQRCVLATRSLEPLPLEGKFLGCSTAKHSVIVTDKAAYTWGTNQHGQLAQEDKKVVDQPTQIDDFLEYRSSSLGGFEALTSDHERIPLQPLVDTECNAHYSVAWTTRRLYAWGLNSGQIITEPKGKCGVSLVYDFKAPLQQAACLDNAIVTLCGGKVSVFMDGERKKLDHTGVEIKGRGRFYVLKSDSGRLYLYHLKKLDSFTRIPIPKSEPVVSFDVAETGLVVIATKFTVYTWSNGGELTELSGSSRYDLRKLCCDSRGTSFLAVQEYFVPPETIVGGTTLAEDLTGICAVEAECNPRIPQPFSFFEDNGDFETGELDFDWKDIPRVRNIPGTATLTAESKSIQVHKFLLLGRCPALEKDFVSTRGGCQIRRTGDNFEFSTSFDSLLAFVQYLYTGSPKDSPPNSLGKAYRDLQSLVSGTLAIGMLRSKSIEPDTTIQLSDGQVKAHAAILRARSIFFAARLSENWRNQPVDLTQYSTSAFKHYLDFIYSGQVSKSLSTIQGSESQTFDLLVEIWFLADELMHTQLCEIIESVLVECVNFETCLDVLSIFPNAKTLYSVALDFYSRHMDYYISQFSRIPNSLVDNIESGYRKSFSSKVDIGNVLEMMNDLVPSASSSAQASSVSTPVATAATTPVASPAIGSSPSSSAPPSRASPEPKFQIKQSKKRTQKYAPLESARPTPAQQQQQPSTAARPVVIPRPQQPSASASASQPTPIPTTPWRASAAATTGSSPRSSPSPGPSSSSGPSSLPRLGQQPSLPRLGEAKSPPSFRARTPSVPKRLSQRERLRLQQEAANTPPAPPPTPWGRPATAASSLGEQMALLNKDRQRKTKAGPLI